MAATSPVATARALLGAVRDGEPTREHEDALAGLEQTDLATALASDEQRLAFWLNVYNAYAQLLLERWPDEYERSRRRFFGHEAIPVAGAWLSLDDVEHGILRGSQSSLGLGYLPRLFSSRFERRHRLAERDWRVHFALNCGAKSCPPIRVYEGDRIDEQLDIAAESYLEQEVEYDADSGVVRVPRLMLWYRGDFGGGSGIREILREFECVADEVEPKIRYREYDWTKKTRTFV
jgi:hypothetical protein